LKSGQFYHTDYAKGFRNFADSSVPLIITDPPYGIAYHSNHHVGKNPHSPVANDWNFQIGSFLQTIGRVLKVGGAAYVFSRWDVYPIWFPEIAGTGLKLSNVIAWVKDNHSAGDLNGNFGGKYEVILFLTKGRHQRIGKRLTNVWECPRVSHTKALHPTEKPVDLYRRAIEFSSEPGDLVIDPCCGSGPVGPAASSTGREFMGFDVDPKMIAIAQRRNGLPVTVDEIRPLIPEAKLSDDLEVIDQTIYNLHPDDIRDAARCWRREDSLPVCDLFAEVQ
jgi:site-specific DNA-methyltransferase (adenine-specific)